jgi:hypothetical protein
MSFIPGLKDELTKAWDGAVGTISDAAQTVGNAGDNFWSWLTGKDSQKAAEDPAPPIVQNQNEQDAADPVAPLEAVQEQESCAGWSLQHLLHLLRMEAMHNCETKAKIPYLKVKEAQEKNTELTTLLETFTAESEETGEFKIKDDNTAQLIAKARAYGVVIPNKESFSKAERDTIIRNLDQTLKVVDHDIRIGFNDAQEALQQRNTFYQELKTCWDKICEAIRKLIQAISQR